MDGGFYWSKKISPTVMGTVMRACKLLVNLAARARATAADPTASRRRPRLRSRGPASMLHVRESQRPTGASERNRGGGLRMERGVGSSARDIRVARARARLAMRSPGAPLGVLALPHRQGSVIGSSAQQVRNACLRLHLAHAQVYIGRRADLEMYVLCRSHDVPYVAGGRLVHVTGLAHVPARRHRASSTGKASSS